LRPPLLDYGLKSALNELADNLMELSQDNIIIRVDLDPDNGRYDALIELYVFRIIQEACGNSIRHGQAQKILISGSLDSQQINLVVHDDGIGFMASQGLGLNNLIANEHFGLAGMVERAELIGAVLKITSEPKAGTVVQLILNLNGSKVP
jgi:two-component system sensor histidine kinase DegS